MELSRFQRASKASTQVHGSGNEKYRTVADFCLVIAQRAGANRKIGADLWMSGDEVEKRSHESLRLFPLNRVPDVLNELQPRSRKLLREGRLFADREHRVTGASDDERSNIR